jgi:hypothetical protein
MKSLPVFSAIRPVPEFDSREGLRTAVIGAAPTAGRLATSPALAGSAAAPKRAAVKTAEPATGFTMSGFG